MNTTIKAISFLAICATSISAFSIPNNKASTQFSTSKSPSSTTSSTALFSTIELADGVTKTINQQGNGIPLKFGDIAIVKYTCSAINNDDKTTFAKSNQQKVVVGDGVMIPGWEVALSTMTPGESSTIRITDSVNYGYGPNGVPPIIPGNAVLEMDMEIVGREDAPTMGTAGAAMAMMNSSGGSGTQGFLGGGSGDMGMLDPSKPRTPEAIAAAYKARQQVAAQAAANVETKEGLEGLIEKAKSFYFFGLFEGETGQQAPWFLRPSITFPLAFAFVGLGFYITFAFGGITERGSQVTDELDDIILSMNGIRDLMVVAFASMSV